MRHNYIKDDKSGDHWAVNHNGYGEVIVQVQEDGNQARIKLTIEQAMDLANKILHSVEIAKTQDSVKVALEKYTA